MLTTKFFPPITSILPIEALPNELGFVKTGLTNILSRIYFRDLQYSHNDRGDAAFYSLSIVSLHRLDIEIPGTGIFLILNPSHDPQSPDISEFPITLSYKWPILGHLREFNLQTFSFQPGDIFDLAARVLGVTPRQLLERALSLFVPSASPIDTFVDDLNTLFGTSIAHPSPTSTDPLGDVLEAIDNTTRINGAGGAVFALYLLDALGEDATRQRISTFFEEFFDGDRIEDYITQLITPKIEATLELGVALEFPRNVLEPLDKVGGEPLEDETVKTWLTFDAGAFFYSNSGGIGFDQHLVASLNHPSRIAGTSLGISLNRAKLDISRTTNIPEADADGRPADFVGVYIDEATISFPTFWNHDADASTGIIKAQSLIMGTGGASGTFSLEAKSNNHPAPLVKVSFGKDPNPAKRFSVSLDSFSLKLKQNVIEGSNIEGTMVMPGFKDANGAPAEIRIKVAIRQGGDFDITAQEDDGFKEIKFGNIFNLKLKKVFVGRRDDDFYVGMSGTIKFTAPLLDGIDPIEVENLLLWSDKRIEIQGGTFPLPKNARFDIGPAKLSITSISLGSHQQKKNGVMRKYSCLGFDAAIDVNPSAFHGKGNGIKFYFTVDDLQPFDSYLEIKSLKVDMVFPGNVGKEQAKVLISGSLSIGRAADATKQEAPEYKGEVTIKLRDAGITASASMKLAPKTPAFLVNVAAEFTPSLPLGPTHLGIYAIEGLIGHRYVATKHAVFGDAESEKTWFDYYKAPPEGIDVDKFEKPNQTKNYDNPFSVGAGVIIASSERSGKTFSCKVFLLFSLPGLLYLEGKANILGERVKLKGTDPQFFAFLAITPQTVEAGFGANYKLPTRGLKKGLILDMQAEVRAAFFFKNSSAWYINFGTAGQPTPARAVSLLDASAYLMLSASGIEAGASATFGFKKKYARGLVNVSVGAYIALKGFLSFHGPQIGGSAMLGGHIDASLMWVSFYIGLDISLSVEAPTPFYVQGSVHLCVGITIGFWKFKKVFSACFDVEFKWVKDTTVDTAPALPFTDLREIPPPLPPLSCTNMISAESFKIAFLGTDVPAATSPLFNEAVIPLDTWIDFEFLKGLAPGSDVDERIGRLSGQAPAHNVEQVPPVQVAHKVKHQYSIKALEIKAWSGSAWVDYRPYQAMIPPAALAGLGANLSAYKDGYWQNTGDGFNKIRLLAETSLSYMQQAEPETYIPEQFGITSATLFCRTSLRDEHCIRWTDAVPGTVWPDGAWQQIDATLFSVFGGPGTVVNWNSPLDIPRSLAFANDDRAQIVFNEPCVKVNLKLTTFSSGAVIRFYKRETAGARFIYTLVETRELMQLQLLAQVEYSDPAVPVAKVEIDPFNGDPTALYGLRVQIDNLYRQLYEDDLDARQRDTLLEDISEREGALASLNEQGCRSNGFNTDILERAIPDLEQEIEECNQQLAVLLASQIEVCNEAADFRALFQRCFPFVPSVLSYEIVKEGHTPGHARFRFYIYDDQADSILLKDAQLHLDTSPAKSAMFDALELALDPEAYQLLNTGAGQYSFQIVDDMQIVRAVSPAVFATAQQRDEFVAQTQARIQAAHADGTFTLEIRVAGQLPCAECLDHLNCWNELTAFGEVDAHSCLNILASIIAARDAYCSQYNRLYRQLYACNSQLLDEVTSHCEELTREVEIKRAQCESLSEQLAAIRQLLIYIAEHGPLLPPEGFPCSTLLHEACCLSFEDYQFNLSVPEQEAIEQDYHNAVQAVERTLAAVWKPSTKYYIRLKVTDTVDDNKSTDSPFYYFGFRTSGPLGFYHTDQYANYVLPPKTPDQYVLTNLRGYIDYKRSIPSPDGQLVGAKPLFYEDARVLLFFTKRYVYHFFNDWPAYNGLPAINGSAMQLVIIDPVEDISLVNPPPPLSPTTEIPRAVTAWPKDDDPRIPEDIRTLINLRHPELLNPDFMGGECWTSGGDMITPASVYVKVTPQYLKPLKLYTVVVNNVYLGQAQEVHRFVCQTSRYADFKAQVNSYQLDDGRGNKREAIFRLDVPLSVADLNLMHDVVTGNMTGSNATLAGLWADPFDRLVEGVMKLPPLDAPISTEFNIVRNSTTDAVVAIWIRNPEPFNDSRLPDDILSRSLRVMNGLSPNLNYTVLFSKDGSQAFVMHPSRVIPATQIQFRFVYIEWDGFDYVDRTVIITSPIPTNI